MRLDNSRESRNVEDRRGRRMHVGGRGKIGIGTVVLALVAIYFGVDPSVLLQGVGEPTSDNASYDTSTVDGRQTPELQFVSRVLGDTEQTWHSLFERHQLGIMGEVNRARGRMNPTQANALSVRVELQADCFSGVWAHHSDAQRGTLEAGDIEEGLNAAAAIGDDRLQKRTQGHVVPDSFTHGTSAQRVRWFTRGYESGNPADCDTFAAAQL